MPRFYFNLREEAKFTSVDAGGDLNSLEVAQRVAAEAAAEIGRDRSRQDDDVRVEVRNEPH